MGNANQELPGISLIIDPGNYYVFSGASLVTSIALQVKRACQSSRLIELCDIPYKCQCVYMAFVFVQY